MDELLGSWTLTWFIVLNIATLALSGIYYLFESKSKNREGK